MLTRLMFINGLKNNNIEVCFTSMLTRAINTLEILLKELENNTIQTIKAWELNERHYGSLTGLNKAETKKPSCWKVFCTDRWEEPYCIYIHDGRIMIYREM